MLDLALRLLPGFCLLLLFAGCGDGRPQRVPVSGLVLIDGAPVTHGTIRFIPNNARASVGNLGSDGHFTLTCFDGLDGAVLGSHRIEVAASEIRGENTLRWHAPKRYADVNTSGLTAEITGPTNDLVINLSWVGGKMFDERD